MPASSTSSEVIDHTKIEYEIKYIEIYFVMWEKNQCDMEQYPFPKSEKKLMLSMFPGAYDAVRMHSKKIEYRSITTFPKKQLTAIENKIYTEIHMFRGHKTEYVRTPWMRLKFDNTYKITEKMAFEAGPYDNNWKSVPMNGKFLELTLGDIIMEGGPLYKRKN